MLPAESTTALTIHGVELKQEEIRAQTKIARLATTLSCAVMCAGFAGMVLTSGYWFWMLPMVMAEVAALVMGLWEE